ncbi:YojF family protein [Bacillaceae bacterium]
MQPINAEEVQRALESFAHKDVYLHLETTNGAYASHFHDNVLQAGAYIRNGRIRFQRGKIAGSGPYRVGLKLDLGWVYAEGLTHWELDEMGRLLMAGIDSLGKLAVALELSHEPF